MASSHPPLPGVEASAVQRAQDDELLASTRTTSIAAGAIILVAFPLWGVFDTLVEPDRAAGFIQLRLAFCVPILFALLLLRTDVGERWAEPLSFVVLALPLIPIAVMLPQVERTFEGYLLGYSLVLFGTVFLLISRLRITIGLIIVTWVAAATSFLAQSEKVDDLRAGLLVFYLGTASLLALVGRYYRLSAERETIATRVALEREQERTLALVAELDRLSREDSLTGLANRRAWDEGLHRACALADRHGTPFAVVLLDLDRFKSINDRYGHVRGDEVLATTATALRQRVRTADLLARIGGDEFAVLCPATDAEQARRLARDLTVAVEQAPDDLDLSASAGTAVWRPGDTPHCVSNRADHDMYRVKSARRS